MTMAMIGGGVAAAGGIFGAINANQDRQNAKGMQGQANAAGAQGYADRAPYRALSQQYLQNNTAPNLSGIFSGGPQYNAVSSPLLSQSQDAQRSLLDRLSNGPDYLSQARSALNDFDTSQQPVLAAQRRLVGQKAAALGRIGSGGVTTDLGNLQSDYERNRQLTANQLIQGALDRSQQDRYATLGAATGIQGQQYAQGAAERANQQGVAQQGIQNRANQYGTEQGTMNTRNQLGLNLGALGTGYNPSGVFQGAADRAGASADQSGQDVAGLFNTVGNYLGQKKSTAPATTIGSAGMGETNWGK